MTGEPTVEYVAGALRRLADEAFEIAQRAHHEIAAKNSALGRYQSGSTLTQIRAAREEAFDAAARKMERLALEVADTTKEAGDILGRELRELRGRLQADLTKFYSGKSWAADLQARLIDEFTRRTDAIVESVLDDYQHGMLQGTRFHRDTLVTVTTSVTNSPGAVVQSGHGNVQRKISTRSTEIRSAISAFTNSAEVLALQPDQRQSLIDVTDVIEGELNKAEPDLGKLTRWGQRLQGMAEQLGVAVAAEAILRLLFGG